MATATRTGVSLVASQSNSAGGTVTGTGRDISSTFGGLITGRITNGGTGPTIACDMLVQVATDGSTWYEVARFTAERATNGVYDFALPIYEAMHIRVVFTGNTGQAVTVVADFHEFTSTT